MVIRGLVPYFVRVGDFIVELVIETKRKGNYAEYTDVLIQDIIIADLSLTHELHDGRVRLTDEVSTILSRDEEAVIEFVASRPGRQRTFLLALQKYTSDQLTSQYDNNYYIYKSTTDLLRRMRNVPYEENDNIPQRELDSPSSESEVSEEEESLRGRRDLIDRSIGPSPGEQQLLRELSVERAAARDRAMAGVRTPSSESEVSEDEEEQDTLRAATVVQSLVIAIYHNRPDSDLWDFIQVNGRLITGDAIRTRNQPQLFHIYKRLVEISDRADPNRYMPYFESIGSLLYVISLFFSLIRLLAPEDMSPKFNAQMDVCYNVVPKLDVIRGYLQDCYQRDIGIPDNNFKFENYRQLKLRVPTLATIARAPFATIRRDNIAALINMLLDANRERRLAQVLQQLSARSDFKLLVEHEDITDWLADENSDWIKDAIPANTPNAVLRQLRDSVG